MQQARALHRKKKQSEQQQTSRECKRRAYAGHALRNRQCERIFQGQLSFYQAHTLRLHFDVDRAAVLTISAQGKTVQVVGTLFHASGIAVASAADMPTSVDVFIQVNLVQHVGPHPDDERVTDIRYCALARGVVMVNAEPDPGRSLLQSQPKVAGKRCKAGLGNGVYRSLVLRVMQVSALDVVARHGGPRQRLEQQQKQKNDLFH